MLGCPYRWTRPHVINTELSSAQTQSRTQSQFCLSESLPRAVIFLIVKLRRGFSQLSFVYVLSAFNIFLITYFCVVSSFVPPLDHKRELINKDSWENYGFLTKIMLLIN